MAKFSIEVLNYWEVHKTISLMLLLSGHLFHRSGYQIIVTPGHLQDQKCSSVMLVSLSSPVVLYSEKYFYDDLFSCYLYIRTALNLLPPPCTLIVSVSIYIFQSCFWFLHFPGHLVSSSTPLISWKYSSTVKFCLLFLLHTADEMVWFWMFLQKVTTSKPSITCCSQ